MPGQDGCCIVQRQLCQQGEAFLRMNVACPRCTLTKALEQMEKAINGLSLQ